MQTLTKMKWLGVLILSLVACGLVGCTAGAKRARYMKKAEAYFKQGDYIKAEIEYRNALRFSKTLDPNVVARVATICYEQGRLPEAFQLLTTAVSSKPDDLDLQYKLGTMYVTVRDYTNARASALIVLAKNPGHHEAKLLLADAAQKPEEIAAAREKMNELLKSNGDSWAAHVALAQLALREKNFDLAEKEVEMAAKLDAKASPVNLTRAQLASVRKQPQEVERLLPTVAENAPARSPQRLLLAQSKMQGTNVAEAKVLVDAILKEAPDYVPAWVLRGRIALVEQDYAECSRIAQNVLSWDPSSYDIHLLKARTLVMQDQPAKAIEEFQLVEKLTRPQNAEPRYEMAVAYVRNGEVEEALKKLDEAIRLHPDYTEAVILQAELKMRTGFPDQVVASLAPFTKNHPEVIQASVVLATAYSALGRLDEALAVYRGLIRKAPSVPEFWFLEGSVFLQQANYDKARSSFEQALTLAPAYVLAAEQLLNLDLGRNDFVGAQRRVEEQLKLTTNSPAALLLQAKYCFAKLDWSGAESALIRVIKAEPTAAGPYSLLANVYLATGDPRKALTQLQAAVEKNPKDFTALFIMATVYDGMKDYTQAKKNYEEVVKLNPKMPAALNNLAYMLSEGLNQVDEALPYATKAREVDPKDGGIADTLGWIFYRRGDYGRALPLLSESAGAGTLAQNPEVQYHLAMARYAIGDEAGARASFSRVIALNRSFAEAKGVPRRLAVLDLEPASPGAIETLEAAMKEGGNDFVAAMKLGQAYERAGAYEKARSAFERAARISPTSTKPLLFLASLNAGKLNDLPKALEAARAARKLAPNDPVTAGVLGRVSYRANDYAAALALLYEYARSSAADAESLYDLALSYYSAGQFDDARSNLRNYIAAARGGRIDEAKNLIVLMDFQAGKGDAGQSEKIASGRLQQAPDDPPALMTLGLVAQRAQKYPEAAQKFEQLLSANKAFSPAQRQLAMLYGEYLGNDAKAAEYGSKARTAFASDVQLAKVLGKVAYRRGEFGYATDLLAQTAKDPNADAETFYYLGMAYYKARQPVEAKNALKRALALNLDARLGAEASRVLKEIP